MVVASPGAVALSAADTSLAVLPAGASRVDPAGSHTVAAAALSVLPVPVSITRVSITVPSCTMDITFITPSRTFPRLAFAIASDGDAADGVGPRGGVRLITIRRGGGSRMIVGSTR